MNTNWSTPKTNFLAGMLDLRKALASGMRAKLIRARNEDCNFPIKVKNRITDFRIYEFSNSTLQTRTGIAVDQSKNEFNKYLTLTFKTCYGTPEAVQRYYSKGKLSPDNFKGVGTSHLVKVEDMVRYLEISGDPERASMFRQQYLTEKGSKENYFYDNYRYKYGSPWATKLFRRKLWVVELLKPDVPEARVPVLIHVLNVLLYPLKYIPRRSILRMADYKCITFRIGSVVNGISVEFNIPKRFSFK